MNIIVDNVIVKFGTPDGKTLTAVGPVSFDIEAGSFVTLLGPSGSGKSTIIRAISGLQPISSGAIKIDTLPVTEPHQSVGIMFQDATLMPWRSVIDNIALPLEVTNTRSKDRTKAIKDILPLLGLEDFANAFPAELSGGMAQRVSLGRALVQHPNVLILDEPFGALDALTREKISFDLLKIWAQYQQTVVMVTHDINESVLLSDRVLVLSQRPGRVIADIKVPLERPRTVAMIYTQPFIDTAKTIREAINRA